MNKAVMDCSVIIPMYNAEKTILRALASLEPEQTALFSIEIILVDDGSSDNSSALAEKNYPSVKVISKENGGVSSARNEGLRHACGRYVYFMDADDTVYRSALESMLREADNTGADLLIADYVCTSGKNIADTVKTCDLPANELLDRSYIETQLFPRIVDGNIEGFATLWNKLYRREIIERFQLHFNEERTHGEDWEFNLRYADVAETLCYQKGVILYRYDISSGMPNLAKYKAKLSSGYLQGHRLMLSCAEKYSLFERDDMLRYRILRDTAYKLICTLRMAEIPEKEKKQLLKQKEVKQIFAELSRLPAEKLSRLSLSRKDKAAYRALSLGCRSLALKMIS